MCPAKQSSPKPSGALALYHPSGPNIPMPIPFFATISGIKPSSYQEKPLGPSSAHWAMSFCGFGETSTKVVGCSCWKGQLWCAPPKNKGITTTPCRATDWGKSGLRATWQKRIWECCLTASWM